MSSSTRFICEVSFKKFSGSKEDFSVSSSSVLTTLLLILSVG